MTKMKIHSIITLIFICSILSGSFRVYAETSRQRQWDIMFVLDNSGSMKKSDPDFQMRNFVREFVRHLRNGNRVGIVVFDENVRLSMKLTPATDKDFNDKLNFCLQRIDYQGLLTKSPSAIEKAVYELKHSGRKGVEKCIIFLTDGIVDTGDKTRDAERSNWLENSLTRDAKKNDIRMYCIAFTEEADFQLIQTLAQKTDGEYFRASKVEDINTILTEINTILTKPVEVQPTPSRPVQSTGMTTSVPEKNAGEITRDYYIFGGGVFVVIVLIIILIIRYRNSQKIFTEQIMRLQEIEEKKLAQAREATEKRKEEASKVEPVQTVPVVESRSQVRQVPETSPPDAHERIQTSEPIGAGDSALEDGLDSSRFNQLLKEYEKGSVQEPEFPSAMLEDLDGSTGKLIHRLTKPVINIGRQKKINDIVIPKQTISKQHARIEYRDNSFYLVDLRSSNGTFLNDLSFSNPQKMSEVPLKSGDKIAFDVFRFQFLLEEADRIDKTMLRGIDVQEIQKENLQRRLVPFAPTVKLKSSDIWGENGPPGDLTRPPESHEIPVGSETKPERDLPDGDTVLPDDDSADVVQTESEREGLAESVSSDADHSDTDIDDDAEEPIVQDPDAVNSEPESYFIEAEDDIVSDEEENEASEKSDEPDVVNEVEESEAFDAPSEGDLADEESEDEHPEELADDAVDEMVADSSLDDGLLIEDDLQTNDLFDYTIRDENLESDLEDENVSDADAPSLEGEYSGEEEKSASQESGMMDSTTTETPPDTDSESSGKFLLMCYNHPDRRAKEKCMLCGLDFCAECLIEKDGQVICKDCEDFGDIIP